MKFLVDFPNEFIINDDVVLDMLSENRCIALHSGEFVKDES